MRSYLHIFLLAVLLGSCSGNDNKWPETKTRKLEPIKETTVFSNDLKAFPDREGIIGVADIPEMLCLSIMDTATFEQLPEKVSAAYELLQQQADSIGAETNAVPGYLSYNNNTKNVKFECVLPIRAFPKKQPRKAKIVVLEADKMVVCNYYGTYRNLFTAYGQINQYIQKNRLQQTGPMREFYMSDPATQTDQSKWLTRIFVPVTKSENDQELLSN